MKKLDKLLITLETLQELGLDIDTRLIDAIREETYSYAAQAQKPQNQEIVRINYCKDEKQPGHHLLVRLPDGTVLRKNTNFNTFTTAIFIANIDTVFAQNLYCGDKPLLLVDRIRRGQKYKQITTKYYLKKIISANYMSVILKKISDLLDLRWEVIIE